MQRFKKQKPFNFLLAARVLFILESDEFAKPNFYFLPKYILLKKFARFIHFLLERKMTENASNKMVIAIEGSIGVGKSTVLKELERRGHIVQTEPVEHWTLLHDLYKDMEKYGALFQVQVLATYASYKPRVQFLERSAQSARGVFSAMMYRDGYITPAQLQTIDSVAKMIPVPAPEVFVYLEAEAELCQSRIQWRARDGEEAVELKYLRKLDAAYKDWLPSVRHFVIKVKASDSPSVVADSILNTLRDARLLV